MEEALIPEEKGLDASALVGAGEPRPGRSESDSTRCEEGTPEERQAE
jgi:hypothetical protein